MSSIDYSAIETPKIIFNVIPKVNCERNFSSWLERIYYMNLVWSEIMELTQREGIPCEKIRAENPILKDNS